ncbi:MAG: hypothetical protein GY856_46875, partial [bacterium]|nr:hypothetical protein [bacterium]
LMHQLMLRYADCYDFVYEPTSGAGGDAGIDALAPDGVPGLEGVVAFQFKWRWGGVDKGNHARDIKDSLKRAAKRPDIAHWVLVTPEDFRPSETKWFNALPVREGLRLHHWGRERVESLLLDYSALFARYYPEQARLDHRPELAGYDGFDFTEFAGAYRKQVAVIHEHIRTLGLPPETLREDDARRTIRLRDIFVPLTLHPAGEGGRSQSLAEALRSQRTLVVLGDPGTGKSTLLSFLALLYAGTAELPGFTPPRGVVPLII